MRFPPPKSLKITQLRLDLSENISVLLFFGGGGGEIWEFSFLNYPPQKKETQFAEFSPNTLHHCVCVHVVGGCESPSQKHTQFLLKMLNLGHCAGCKILARLLRQLLLLPLAAAIKNKRLKKNKKQFSAVIPLPELEFPEFPGLRDWLLNNSNNYSERIVVLEQLSAP